MNPDRNTILAMVLAAAVLIGWEFLYPTKRPQPAPAPAANSAPATPISTATPPAAALGETPSPDATPEQRLKIATPRLHGSLTLTGGRFDDITLADYRDTLDPKSPEVVLFSPSSAAHPYYAEIGWLAGDTGTPVPTPTTVWSAENPDATLTESTPVVLTWDNGQGLKFARTIHVDKDYLFTVEQSVENSSDKAVTLFPYSRIVRLDTPTAKTSYIQFEGPIGVFGGSSQEKKYADVKKDGTIKAESTGGWIGFTDKYWLSAIAFAPSVKIAGSFNFGVTGNRDHYQTDLRADGIAVAPGAKASAQAYLFAGAKELGILDGYSTEPGLPRLDLAIDFGWFWFLTIPFFHALRWLHGIIGNFGLAIIAFSTGVRLLMFPIANKQYKTMNRMKVLQPQVKALQDRHASDRNRLNQEMMELYKREKVNPLSGCAPIIVQIPVFYALYKVLYGSIEMRHAPFYGWIHDLSAPDPTSVLNLFGALPYTIPSFLVFVSIGAWPLIYGITMFLQQRMTPVSDPAQAKVMMYMPVIFTFILAQMPVGLLIYWAWGNLLGILQQSILLRKTA